MSTVPVQSPDLTPAVGDATLVSYFDSAHNVQSAVAHVLAVSQLFADGISDEGHPALTVAYPAAPANLRVLAGPRWSDAYVRAAGVKHISHPDVVAGRESIAWGGSLSVVASSIPKPAGDGSNPIFDREEATAPDPAGQIEQAVAVQGGKIHEPTVISPLTSEAGFGVNPPSSTDPGITNAPESPVGASETTGTTETSTQEPAAAPAATEEPKPTENPEG